MATATDEEAALSAADEATIQDTNAALAALGDGETSLEEMSEEQGQELEEVAPTQLAIPGTREKIPRSTGGRAPERSEIRIMGGRRPIIGSFEKGERVTFLTTATIRAVEDIDIDDEWGRVSETVRAHKARQLHVQVATPETLIRALANMGFDRAAIGVLYDEVAG